jgi:hypothetical protein
LVEHPGSRLRRLAGSRAREVQFHRLLRNDKVRVAEMARAAGEATGLRVRGRDIALIQDTSEIAVGCAKAGRAGFGPVGKGGAVRGLLLHAAIAVDSQGALLGLVDQQVWTRTGGEPVSGRRRPFAEKESHRWLATCETAAARLQGARSLTMVADAESDIYELYANLPQGVDVLVRAARDRHLGNGLMLGETVAALKPAGVIERIIPAAPGRKERLARLELRFAPVSLKRPRDLPRKAAAPELGFYVLDVRETDCPQDVPPAHWLLLTSHAIATKARAAEIADLYRGRFLIEQLFRTLKSAGFNIEEAEIGEPQAMIVFTAFATIAAVSVMQLVKARDGGSGQLTADCFQDDDKPLLAALSRKLEGKTQKQKNPHPPDDLAFASWIIARLGGWTGYYGKPGPQTMRYGLERYHAIKLGAEIAKNV